MSIKINKDNLAAAVETHPQSKSKIAAFADTTVPTLDKLLAGDTDFYTSSIEKIADYLGFDVEINFRKREQISANGN